MYYILYIIFIICVIIFYKYKSNNGDFKLYDIHLYVTLKNFNEFYKTHKIVWNYFIATSCPSTTTYKDFLINNKPVIKQMIFYHIEFYNSRDHMYDLLQKYMDCDFSLDDFPLDDFEEIVLALYIIGIELQEFIEIYEAISANKKNCLQYYMMSPEIIIKIENFL